MKFKDKLILWLIGLFVLCFFIYSIRSILLPFIVAIIAAYFLDPAADKIQKLGFSRLVATAIITILFFTVLITSLALLAPVIYDQIITFLSTVPDYISHLNATIKPAFTRIMTKIDPGALEKAKDSINEVSGYAFKFVATLAGNLWNSGMAMLNLISLIFITPVVTFYMLRDWDKMVSKVNSWLPPKHAKIIRKEARAINNVLSGYIRGQTHVCIIMGILYAILLTFAGLEFSLFIGLANGILLFIPYVGALFGFSVGILVAFFQFGYSIQLAIIAGIFLAGQVLESIFITPNLVGNEVGLHPVWVMFGLLAGGVALGFIGVLLAVPVAAVIGVLTRFLLGEYLKNR